MLVKKAIHLPTSHNPETHFLPSSLLCVLFLFTWFRLHSIVNTLFQFSLYHKYFFIS